MSEKDMRELTDMHGKLSDARSKLGAALYKCELAHKRRPKEFMNQGEALFFTSSCQCDGCRIKKDIMSALEELET